MGYQLRVLRAGDPPFEMEVQAESVEEAMHKAEAQGFTVLKIKSRTQSTSFLQSTKQFPVLLFCREFGVLLNAGLSVSEVIETLIGKSTQPHVQATLQTLLSNIQQGQSLSQAMENVGGEVFPTLLVTSIRTAETTGDIPQALARYQHYAENLEILKKKVISASIYPAIVVGFGFAVFAFLLLHVIPKFSHIYRSQVAESSQSKQFILWLGDLSEKYSSVLIGLFILIAVGCMVILTNKQVRSWMISYLFKIPYWGEKFRTYHLSRLYRAFSMLLASGVSVPRALALVENMLDKSLTSNLKSASEKIQTGALFSEAFNQSGLSTIVADRLFRIGEKSGAMDIMMAHAADYHDEEMLRWVDRFTKVLEPVLMAVIGLLIGGLVLMMYLPIFDLAGGLE